MKRIIRIIAIIMAFTILSSSFVYAADTYSKFFFVVNGLTATSEEWAVKEGSGNAYVQLLSSYDGIGSNIFQYGATFYARTRLAIDPSAAYSNLATFYGIDDQYMSYPAGMAKVKEYYVLRTEVDVSIGSGAMLTQPVAWHP